MECSVVWFQSSARMIDRKAAANCWFLDILVGVTQWCRICQNLTGNDASCTERANMQHLQDGFTSQDEFENPAC